MDYFAGLDVSVKETSVCIVGLFHLRGRYVADYGLPDHSTTG